MDFDHHSPPRLNSSYLYQHKSMDEIGQALVLKMELHETRLRAEEDLKSRDAEILRLKNMLSAAIKERDEAHRCCKKLLLDKILLLKHYQSAPNSAISSVDDDPTRGIDFSSSDGDESIASSPPRMPPPVAIKGPLPEKGKLLEAVAKAGPLLQTLLLAGPLPQWRHPPPAVDPHEIPSPPVSSLPPRFGGGGKRGVPDGFDWSKQSKHHKGWTYI